jgi:hypothetical protein
MIELTEKIRHNGKVYSSGGVIKNIEKEEAKRLVELGVAFFVSAEVETDDYSELLDKAFNADELKEVSKEIGLEFPGNISKGKLIEKIIDEGLEEDVLALSKGE